MPAMIKKIIVFTIFLFLFGLVGHYDMVYGKAIKATKKKIIKFECTQYEYDLLVKSGATKTVLKLSCRDGVK